MKRVFLIVLDSFGIGEAPDAAEYGDQASGRKNEQSESYTSKQFVLLVAALSGMRWRSVLLLWGAKL